MALGIRYNAPVILTFALISTAVYAANWIIWGDYYMNVNGLIVPNKDSLMGYFFVVPGIWDWGNLLNYFRIFSYPLGHADMGHLLGNMSLFLLIGPIVEEKYGSKQLLQMFIVTTVIVAILQILLFSSGGLGASGLVFMLIVLVSFTERNQGGIPLTFILVVAIYLGKEIYSAFEHDNISQFAHIAGGVMGAIFGFSSKK